MLKITDLKVAYGEHQVLKGLSGSFQYNHIHGVLGMNGAGKTTLFNTIYGLVNRTAGQITLNEKPIDKKQIAFMETATYFYPFLKGKEYLQLLAMGNNSFDINAWNQIFQLPLDSLIDGYSTGMKKQLAFLGTLALDRDVMILDEPFSGVDIENNEKIYQILERLKSQNKILILSSHIISTLTQICDKISYLNGGQFLKTYEPAEYKGLEHELKDLVKAKIDSTLDQLL